MIHPDCGGQARFEGKYIVGAPEMVVEVSYSSWAVDLNDKRNVYQAARSRVRGDRPPRRRGPLARPPGRPVRNGRSRRRRPVSLDRLPRPRLDPVALIDGDAARLIATVDRGTATPEHAAFVERLAAARGDANQT